MFNIVSHCPGHSKLYFCRHFSEILIPNELFRTTGQTRKCVPQNKKCIFSKGVPDKSWHNLGLPNMSLLAKWMSDQRTQCRFSELKNIKKTWKKQFLKSWYFRSKSWHILVQKPQIEKRVLDSDLAGLIHSSTRRGDQTTLLQTTSQHTDFRMGTVRSLLYKRKM